MKGTVRAFAAQAVCVPASDLANSPQEIPFDDIWMRSYFTFCLLEQRSQLHCVMPRCPDEGPFEEHGSHYLSAMSC